MKKAILVIMFVMSFATGAQSKNPSGIDIDHKPRIIKKGCMHNNV